MKFIKVLLIIVLVLVVIAIILGLMGPKKYDVSSTAQVDAPVELVFPYLKSLEKGNEWGPWRDEDPEMEVTYEGEDATVGSSSSWDGPMSGKGTQTVTSITEDASVTTDIVFNTPFGDMESQGYFEISPVNGGSEVTWGFKGTNNFIARILSTFSDMEANVRPMFEKGLNNLDSLVQHDMNKLYNGQKVQYTNIPARQFVAKRATLPIEGMQGFYAQHLPRLAAAVARAGVEMDGMPAGLYYSWDEENGQTDMAAAIPVNKAVSGRDMQMVNIDSGPGLLVDYYGPYDGLGGAHEGVDAYMQNFDLEFKHPIVEEYVTDPSTQPDTSKWLTKIYYYLDE